jgi:hypothetical protein
MRVCGMKLVARCESGSSRLSDEAGGQPPVGTPRPRHEQQVTWCREVTIQTASASKLAHMSAGGLLTRCVVQWGTAKCVSYAMFLAFDVWYIGPAASWSHLHTVHPRTTPPIPIPVSKRQ